MAGVFFAAFFNAVYNQERLILQTIYVLNKGILQKNPRFINKSGFKSRAGYDGAQTVSIKIYILEYNIYK